MPLRIYPVSLELIRSAAPLPSLLRARSVSLGDQFERALTSVPLNIAEGDYSRGKNRQTRYHSALASAREALACLEAAAAFGWIAPPSAEVQALFRQVIATLVRLVQPKR
jgi:four helix bundle protein